MEIGDLRIAWELLGLMNRRQAIARFVVIGSEWMWLGNGT
jgi:hypothetical protein